MPVFDCEVTMRVEAVTRIEVTARDEDAAMEKVGEMIEDELFVVIWEPNARLSKLNLDLEESYNQAEVTDVSES